MSNTQTPSEVAQELGDAFASRDFGRLATLLHPQVRWGGDEETDETCHGPEAVVDCCAALLSNEVTAHVDEVVVTGQRIMVRFLVHGLDESSDVVPHCQVFTIAQASSTTSEVQRTEQKHNGFWAEQRSPLSLVRDVDHTALGRCGRMADST